MNNLMGRKTRISAGKQGKPSLNTSKNKHYLPFYDSLRTATVVESGLLDEPSTTPSLCGESRLYWIHPRGRDDLSALLHLLT
jgi:hypothetical protein